MRLMKYIFIILLTALLSQTISSQNSIKGRITDKTTNEAMPYASIYLPEHIKGTLSNKQGYYELKNIPHGKLTIQFSYVGYKTVIHTVYPDDSGLILNIEMEPSVLQAEEVVVTGGTHSTQHENAIKIELMDAKKIALDGSPSFIEAITGIPGVDMISKGAGVTKPVIRGLSMTNILMLNNGIKMENFQFSENHPFIIDELGIDRVEVIKGPASLLYGSDAVGGVINVIKEKPAPVGRITGDYNIQYHSNTNGPVSNFGIKGSSESFYWGLRGGVKTHTDYRDGNGDYVPNTRFNEYSIKTTMGINKSFGTFKLYYDYSRPRLGMSVGNSVLLVTENGRKNEYWYQDLTNHIISARNTIFLGQYRIEMNASYQMNNRRLQTDETTPAFEMVDMDLNTFSYELKTYLPSKDNSDYIIGFQGANKTNKNHEAPNHVLPDAGVNDFSVFTLIQHKFFNDLKTQAGVRYDYRNILTKGEAGEELVNNDYGNISASLGATYRVTEKILLRANLASAYRTPNIAELTQDGMHGVRYERGNSNLKSQRSYEADISTHYHSDYIMADLSLFYNRIRNYIFLAPTGDTTNSGAYIYKYSQTDSKIYGGELDVDITPFKWLDINATYSYLEGTQDDGSYLPFIPHNKLKTGLKYQKEKILFLNNTFAKVEGVFASKQYRPARFETETDGYFLLNVSAGTEIKWMNQMVSLSVQANNLLNTVYIDHLSTLKEMGYYNMGRNICISLKIPFSVKQ